jgi:indolepyruvate ferredoxin oxidoreductase beta subunit
MKKQIVIAGTGGQGVLFVTRVIVEAAFLSGHPVISSETHGMAMRGGSVISQIKIGNYLSPAIEQGQADVLLGLTRQEAEAYAFYLKPKGKLIVNDGQEGPDRIDADGRARQMGLPRSGNMVFMGFAAQKANLGLKPEKIREAIANLSPARFKDQNLAAFKAGLE